MELKRGYTDNGFDVIEFKDLYGKDCTIQKSSLATEDAVWIGVNKEFARMHLTQEQIKNLLPILTKFVETGELPK